MTHPSLVVRTHGDHNVVTGKKSRKEIIQKNLQQTSMVQMQKKAIKETNSSITSDFESKNYLLRLKQMLLETSQENETLHKENKNLKDRVNELESFVSELTLQIEIFKKSGDSI
eukprot:TRINITY_DN3359_c0_g1_i1.p1 TRINITY_DN3359_c0_g1~~TRINITY_DN3359_c0_g1_i1.p1  ORF type:complete len:122 (+),score=33.16 TRINITY_DN3359_c0_g1_i1:27-368(+)